MEELLARVKLLEDALAKYGHRVHYSCDDSWYACPKAEGGCADERQGTECNCGADKVNAAVDAILSAKKTLSPEAVAHYRRWFP